MMDEKMYLKNFGVLLSAAKEMREEQKLSKEQTLAALRNFLGPHEQPAPVQESLQRLEACHELKLDFLLGQECLRAYGIKK
jgi:hypothetical protein